MLNEFEIHNADKFAFILSLFLLGQQKKHKKRIFPLQKVMAECIAFFTDFMLISTATFKLLVLYVWKEKKGLENGFFYCLNHLE